SSRHCDHIARQAGKLFEVEWLNNYKKKDNLNRRGTPC
ncbi:MAG: hypothetical protein ACI822_001266, partial [Gammaproteobacteria bacterium]